MENNQDLMKMSFELDSVEVQFKSRFKTNNNEVKHSCLPVKYRNINVTRPGIRVQI